MKQILFLSLLFVAANAKIAVIDIVESRQLLSGTLYPSELGYASASALGCVVKNFDGTIKAGTGVGSCPVGSACIDGAVPVCKTLTKVVHQGAGGYDFEAENVINAPTQVDWLSFSDDKTDAAATEGKSNKFLLYRAYLKNINENKYDACHVSVGGVMVDAVVAASGQSPGVLTGGTYDATNQGAKDKNFLSSAGQVGCEFRLKNNGYLGLVSLNVTFTKVSTQMDIGEKPFDSIEAHVRYVPAADDSEWHNPVSTAHKVVTLFPDHLISAMTDKYKSVLHSKVGSVFLFEVGSGYADGYDSSAATALKGTVKLPVKATFFDKRYLIVDQSGVESLKSGVGNGEMRKEGMDIHFDFANFYDSSKNSFTNDQINMNPVDTFSSYVATGVPGVAQYKLEHTYTLTYGGYDANEMPHFSKEYLSCPLCAARVVFKAFHDDNAYSVGTAIERRDYLLRYHVPIVTTNLPTAGNSILLDDVDVDVISSGDGYSKDASGNSISLRLPTSLDPQYPDGHVLGEFFTVKKAAAQTVYASLTAEYTIIDSRLVASTTSGGTAPSVVNCGAGYGKGPLYKLGSDIVSKAQEIFDRDCRIKISSVSFGADSVLTYTNGASVSVATILQTDDRQIMSGSTELSILRRKTDTAARNSGPQVSFDVSKITGTNTAIAFTIKGSNSMLGYGNDGVACTQQQVCATSNLKSVGGVCVDCKTPNTCTDATNGENVCGAGGGDQCATHADYVATGKRCRGVLETGENILTTNTADGVSTEKTIRSSSDCFLYMDVELVDNAAQFASYGLRLPCVRTTAQLEDALNLTYAFSTSYSLSRDLVSAEIDYAKPSGMHLRIKNAGFGSCAKNGSNFDELKAPTTCVDVSGAAQVALSTGFIDDGAGNIDLAEDKLVDLAALKTCDTLPQAVATSADGNSYVMEHYLGLVYARDYLSGGRTVSRTYCQDQKFVTTIRRDASASVTVATLVSPTLSRSVMVSGLNWVKCEPINGILDQNCKGSASCFKYRIDLDVTEKSGDAAWGNATLSSAFLPAVGGKNTDSMSIIEALASQTHKNYLSLESACGPIDSCDSSSHYSGVADGTDQDIVLRGANGGVDVDTAVNIQTKFEECPLEEASVDLGGKLRIGMGLLCSDEAGVYGADNDGGNGAKSTAASEVSISGSGGETNRKRCASALATSNVKVDAAVYLDGLNSANLTKANTAGWHFKNIDFTIERYERDLLGNKDASKRISSDLIMEMRHDGSAYTCTRKTKILFGLPNEFDDTVLLCPTGTIVESDISKMEFDLQPLQAANMDVFEVKVDAVMRNTNLDSRRLRGVLQLKLQADGSVEASSGAFEVLPASKDISDSDLIKDPTKTEDKTHNEVHNIGDEVHNNGDSLIIIMVCALIVAAIAVGVIILRCACAKDDKRLEAAVGLQAEHEKPESRSTRFSNLRY